jgi:hypothetical protein
MKGQKTGGRQKGSRNVKTVQREAEQTWREVMQRALFAADWSEAQLAALTPLDAMMFVLRVSFQHGDRNGILAAATAAAPYVHARLIATTVNTADPYGDNNKTLAELEAELETLRRRRLMFDGEAQEVKQD